MTIERYKEAKIRQSRLRWDIGQNHGLEDENLSKAWFGFFNVCEGKLLDIIIDRRRTKLAKIEGNIDIIRENMVPHVDTSHYKTRPSRLQEFFL